MFNSVFRVLILIIGILYIANVVLFSGCMPRNTDHVTADDELSQALVDSIDPDILRYRGNHEEYDGVKEYIFTIASENADGPVGIFWGLCFKRLDNIFKVTLAGFGYSFLIEVSQLLFYERSSDIDDLILNTTGAFIGALIYFSAVALIKRSKKNTVKV